MQHGHVREPVWIAKRREHPVPAIVNKRDIPDGAILKKQAKLVLADHGYTLDEPGGNVLDMP